MKIVIIGGGPCGLGAAWRTEEIRRQGEIFRIKILTKKKKSFFLKVILKLIGHLSTQHPMLVVLLEPLWMKKVFYGIWVVM